jgi:hypothetical protein
MWLKFDRVLSDYGKLEGVYKLMLPSLKSEKGFQKKQDSQARSEYRNLKALADRATSILDLDAKRLLRFRRSFCKSIVLFTSINDQEELNGR